MEFKNETLQILATGLAKMENVRGLDFKIGYTAIHNLQKIESVLKVYHATLASYYKKIGKRDEKGVLVNDIHNNIVVAKEDLETFDKRIEEIGNILAKVEDLRLIKTSGLKKHLEDKSLGWNIFISLIPILEDDALLLKEQI